MSAVKTYSRVDERMVHDGWYIKWDGCIYWVDLCGNVHGTDGLASACHPLNYW